MFLSQTFVSVYQTYVHVWVLYSQQLSVSNSVRLSFSLKKAPNAKFKHISVQGAEFNFIISAKMKPKPLWLVEHSSVLQSKFITKVF